MVFNSLLIVCGIFLIASGIWGAFKKHPPMDTLGAFLALIGLIASLVGVLLICVPGFFAS
ncbi:MAG: hypothetical protein DRH17_01860 [Deltaproteobacteria bacterium]|nr:MAG: hypothetical protein DRH17_01860 [Deltaproteobacteria bacterium]